MITKLLQTLKQLTSYQQYLIAYSGGIDSHVLLHAMAALGELYPQYSIRSVYIDHGFCEEEVVWGKHCEQVCSDLGIPLVLGKVLVLEQGSSNLEAVARAARYQALAKVLADEECLLTAHTQDDQVETVLMQLFRGAGPKGLSGMPIKKVFSHSLHLRPFLLHTRSEIQQYAVQHQLQWINDHTNNDLRFDRNYLRHQVIPELKERWPAISKNISRSAEHCAAATQDLHRSIEEEFDTFQGKQQNTLSLSALLATSKNRRINILRHWFFSQGCRSPNAQHFIQLERDVLKVKLDAQPLFKIDGKELRRYKDDLYLLVPRQIRLDWKCQWDRQAPLVLPGGLGVLDPEDYQQIGKGRMLTVCFRKGGERLRIPGSVHTKSLKKLFQQWQVPPWERGLIPLIFLDHHLVAVLGYYPADTPRNVGP